MSANTTPDMLELLRELARAGAEQEDALVEAIDDLIDRGFPVASIVEAIQGTEWRFVIENCGRRISVAHRASLISRYGELVDQAVDHLCVLHIVEGLNLPTRFLLQELDARETAGYYTHMVALEADRLARFLMPTDQLPDAPADINWHLSPAGLKWDGQYQIESYVGENDALLSRVMNSVETGIIASKYSSP